MPNTNIQVNVRSESSHHLVSLGGVLDASSEPVLRNVLEPLCQTEQPLIVIDCSGLTYVNSATFGLFFHYHRQCETRHGRLALCCLAPKIESILELLGLRQVLHIHPTVDDALGQRPAAKL